MLKTEHFHLFIWKIFGKLLSLSPQKCIIYHKKQQVMKNKDDVRSLRLCLEEHDARKS